MIPTTLVGSYPVPAWLAATPSRDSLADAIRVVLHTQEQAGIDLLTDGELNRFDINHPETNGMIDYFVGPLSGVRRQLTRIELEEYARQHGVGYRKRPAAVVDAEIEEGTLNLRDDFDRVHALTRQPIKFTVTGPHMLSKVLLDRCYREPEALAGAIADVLARQVASIQADVVQIDEANITGSPHEGSWAAGVINQVLDAVKTKAAVHLCFGNYGGQSVQTGFWRDLLPFMNALRADHLLLEFAHRGYSELEALRDLRPDLGIGLGVIDIKSLEVETPELVASRIEQAAGLLGEERIRFVNPDCGFWMLPRSVADAKISALVKGRDLFHGKQEQR